MGILLSFEARAQKPVQWIEPCAYHTPEHDAAFAALNALDRQIRSRSATADIRILKNQFEALLGTPCFELAIRNHNRGARFRSLLSFETWWHDGGFEWLHSILYPNHVSQHSKGEQPRPNWVTFPPTERQVISQKSTPQHPLLRLLCGPQDPTCGRQTKGWQVQADRVLSRMAQEGDSIRHLTTQAQLRKPSIRRCGESVKSVHPSDRYRAWWQCITELPHALEEAVPLGRVHPPAEGLLVLLEYRKNGLGCLRSRAYNLSTGAAFLTSNCHGDTELSRPSRQSLPVDFGGGQTFGFVSSHSIQHALWMLLNSGHMDSGVWPRSSQIPVPDHVRIGWPTDDDEVELSGFAFGGRSGGGSSHYRVLHWFWLQPNQPSIDGQIIPRAYHRNAESYALELLGLAESSRRQACPEAIQLKALPKNTRHEIPSPIRRTFTTRLDIWGSKKACP